MEKTPVQEIKDAVKTIVEKSKTMKDDLKDDDIKDVVDVVKALSDDEKANVKKVWDKFWA